MLFSDYRKFLCSIISQNRAASSLRVSDA
jgi:hypothetical protein